MKFIRPSNRWPVLAALLVFLVALAPLGWLSARMWQAAVRRDGERLNEFASAGWSQLARERLAHQRMMGAWVARLKAAPALDAAAWEGAFERGALGRFRAVGCAVWEGNERLRVRFCRGEGFDVGTDLATMPEIVAMLAQPPVQNATSPRIMLPGKGERVISLMSFQITDEPSRGIFVTRGVLFALSSPEDFFLPERHNVQRVNHDGSYGAVGVEESFLPGVGEGHVVVQVVSDAERQRVRAAGGLTATRWLNGPLGELHLVYRPGPKFSTDSLASEARLAGGAGTLVALLLAALVWMQARQRSVLTKRVTERTAELVAARDKLHAALEGERELVQMKSQFVNTVSHEFRTPLGVILSSADILTHYLDRLSTETRLEHLHDIHTSSRQMARMLDQVLDLGRIDAGKLAIAPRPLDLTAFLQRIADESHSASGGAPIQLALAGDLAGANGDEALLRHILLNLLSNARKYSPPDAPIEFTARRKGDSAIFTVRDHGIGIPAGDLPHLFESFSRGGNVGDTPGTGLGLAIVKRCTDLQGGTIRIESEESHGALVTVSLPLFL